MTRPNICLISRLKKRRANPSLMSHQEVAEALHAGGEFSKTIADQAGPDPEYCLQLEFSRFGANDRLVFIKDVTEQDKLERMRRDFVGNVSHELPPLTVIRVTLKHSNR